MSIPASPPKRPRPLPDPMHRKQTFWQIWVPMGLSILAILFLAVLAAISAGGPAGPTVTKWSHLSAVYMLIPALIVGFLLLTILALIIYGMAKLLNILPVYTRMVQNFFRQAEAFVRKWSDKSSEPVLAFKSWWAGFETAMKRLGL